MDNQEFSEEQKQYLQGFMSGTNMVRMAQGLPDLSRSLGGNGAGSAAEAAPSGPDAYGYQAQSRQLAEGKKLCEQEVAKRKKNPLDQWDDIVKHSAEGKFPKGNDVLSFKYYGLFHVAPTQDAYMIRLRFANGLITSAQMRAVADAAETYGGNYAHVTTRANIQFREIAAENGANVLMAMHDAGVINKGSGADNIRNVTASATAGIDSQELIDTRPFARAMNHYILNHREMYGLPRKFNIAFDGGGTIHSLEDTNDIGFQAIRVPEGKSVPAGIYFRLLLGGITGHRDFAIETGLLLKPEQCVPMAAAIVRVFIDEGDRTDRKKARLKYVIDRMGQAAILDLARKYLDFEPMKFPLEDCEPRPKAVRNAHVGIHPQKQEGLNYVGVVLMAGRLEPNQMRGLAKIADRYGNGDIRLTVWQNLLLTNIATADLEAVKAELLALDLGWEPTDIRANIIACTGSFGCKFGLSNTKRSAGEIAGHVKERLQLEEPVNIHITGCHHSCAQHYIGDIGLIGAKVEVGEDMVDGYNVFVGGGYGEDAGIGRELFPGILATEAPRVVETVLAAFQQNRQDGESFVEWSRRHSVEELQALSQQQPAAV